MTPRILMKSSTAAFFDEIGRRGHEPLLERVSATVRFDVGDGASVDHRLLRIDRGDIRVTSEDVPADCTVTIGDELLDEIIHGRTGAMPAFLRGALLVEGNPEVLVLVQRLFPGHPARVTSAKAADLADADTESASTASTASKTSEAGREASGTGGPPP
jgi:putative sterol carrier protein